MNKIIWADEKEIDIKDAFKTDAEMVYDAGKDLLTVDGDLTMEYGVELYSSLTVTGNLTIITPDWEPRRTLTIGVCIDHQLWV